MLQQEVEEEGGAERGGDDAESNLFRPVERAGQEVSEDEERRVNGSAVSPQSRSGFSISPSL